MKSIDYPKKDRVKGIYAYCQKCKTTIGAGKCQLSKKRLSSCQYPNFHTFRAAVVVPHTQGMKRKKRILNTTDLQEAIRRKFSFEQELTSYNFQSVLVKSPAVEAAPPLYLIECMDEFVRHLNNDGVEEHKKKLRSQKHIDDVKRYFKFLCLCLKAHKVDHTIFRVEDVSDKTVGWLHDYLLGELKYQNKTYNKVMSQYRQFFAWLIDKRGYQIKNPFVGVVRRKERRDNLVITKKELDQLLGLICEEKGIGISPSGIRRNYFRDWIQTAIVIALETGLRREEFMTLKFSDIQHDEKGHPFCIHVENYKVNRAKGISEEEDMDQKTIPVTTGLLNILDTLDVKQHRGSDRYLIAPNEKARRDTLGELLSKAFTHFWTLTGSTRPIRLKHLRKTYLTALVNYFGDKATIISDHADIDILKKHYTNNEVILKANQGFSVFDT